MNDTIKRAALYGGGALLLAGLGIVWANTSTDADVMTLLSSADVQLRMAYTLPATDRQGREIAEREQLIATAEGYLTEVERLQPGLAVTAEFVGFAHMLRGRYGDAAKQYRLARQCRDCQDEQRDVLAFNEARMLAKAGNRQQALEVFAENGTALDARFGQQRAVEEATILRQLGRRVDAERRLDGIVRGAQVEPMAALQAGEEYEALGHVQKAESAYAAAAKDLPIADYHLARLKLQQGDVDRCLQLLERVADALPAEVRRRLREEAGAWSAVATEARFQRLTSPNAAAPGR